ncbi:MAG: hypothetical protein JOY61_21675 [Chloroflexi bacterium]|nr:hypothetical protein [Chloroflexota bacterium]
MARRKRQTIAMQVGLNLTFDFLLPKEDRIPDWVLERDDTFFAFFAGYLDAEGYIRAYLPKRYRTWQPQLEIRSYDAVLLEQLSAGLNDRGIPCIHAHVCVAAGYTNSRGVKSNCALWRIGLSARASLRSLFENIDPYVRHALRRRQMLDAWRILSVDI